ncbi:TolB family protein [Thalassoroseus pseudoceratinae]|uniref:TolB family protein n=1 Tax=Thalassoroseus pseudoceratinae TaxID=2713176 RepID=UPI001423FE30|nr:PD40 domain-containing protein [Thalassoroseus pseudoceratinae]
MPGTKKSRRVIAVCIGIAVLMVGAGYWFLSRPNWPATDPKLTTHVQSAPDWPVVFTSRTAPASLQAAADEGEEFTFPGKPLWQASEGRLRLLLPNGEVSELTWDRPLDDGQTLIDVMSPSVSPDGTKIVFAGRKPAPNHGHFRLYEINVDGTGLKQLTGGPNDSGATAVPPMRYAEDGETMLSDRKRRQTDYDDIDPIYAPGGHIVFVSSRTPDLGRDHARRSTTLWIMRDDGTEKRPLSANRNNDRWPWLTDNGYVIFSLWSRNREVVSADRTTITPYEPGQEFATAPTDNWMAAHIEPNADFFGGLIKVSEPVWRPRPLHNGRYAFMTNLDGATDEVTVVQAVGGTITSAPSSIAAGSTLPPSAEAQLIRGPNVDASGKPLQLTCPSPAPPDKILLAGSTPEENGEWNTSRYGLYVAKDDWPQAENTAQDVELTLLFDDPKFVDAEPVAVVPRVIHYDYQPLEYGDGTADVEFADGTTYHGPTGETHNSMVYMQNNKDVPGQKSDADEWPIFSAPPTGSIDSIRIFASHRDRFDDPDQPRTPGGWNMLLDVPMEDTAFRFRLPPGTPTVLAGFDADGRVTQWTSPAHDESGKPIKFYAFAGDHYSGTRMGFPHFCTGCHAGHSGTPKLQNRPQR